MCSVQNLVRHSLPYYVAKANGGGFAPLKPKLPVLLSADVFALLIVVRKWRYKWCERHIFTIRAKINTVYTKSNTFVRGCGIMISMNEEGRVENGKDNVST